MTAKGMTEAERAFLSPEEAAALDEAGDDLTPGTEVKNADAAEKANTAAGDDDKADDKADGTDAAAASAAQGTDDGAGKTDEGEGTKAAAEPAASTAASAPDTALPTIPAPAQKDWDALEQAVVAKYEAGELTEAEYRKQIREIAVEQTTANVAASMSTQFAEANWTRDQDRFFRENAQFKDNPGLYAALDAHIVKVDKETPGLSGYELLTKAKEALTKELQGAGITPTPKVDPKVDQKQPAARPKPADAAAVAAATGKAPATLAHLPAAGSDDITADKFAHLDKLEGMELETALARMPEADREAYLAGA